MSENIETILRDPEWLAHRYVESKDAVQFVKLPRSGHAAAAFVTDEHLPAGLPRVEIGRREALETEPPPAPLHFIFHSAFCCSTLVARAFDQPGLSTALKEPPILNDLVGWRRRGAAGRDVAEVMDSALTLLARPFEPGEAVIVKPSNIVSGLIPLLMALRPGAKALLLHAPLPIFLTSVAKKGLDGRLWVRELLGGFRKDGLTLRLGFDDDQLFGQTDLQIAAAGWLAQQALFADLIAKLGPRVRGLDSESLLDRPHEAMAALANLYGLSEDGLDVDGAFARNSKNGEAFSRIERQAEYAKAGAVHHDEIDKVAAWAAAVADAAGIPMTLPGALLA
ncbi:MAG: hypothetical protein JSS55_00480 [Proteobacteria bacterium]|nr:hypothetical protein [Pseudomonadota bacterium]